MQVLYVIGWPWWLKGLICLVICVTVIYVLFFWKPTQQPSHMETTPTAEATGTEFATDSTFDGDLPVKFENVKMFGFDTAITSSGNVTINLKDSEIRGGTGIKSTSDGTKISLERSRIIAADKGIDIGKASE